MVFVVFLDFQTFSFRLGLTWIVCPCVCYSGKRKRLVCLSATRSKTGSAGRLFTHFIRLRDKASFDTDGGQLQRLVTHTNTVRLINSSVCVCVHGSQLCKLRSEPLTQVPGSCGDTDWQMWLGGPDKWWSKVPFRPAPSFGRLFFSGLFQSVCFFCLLVITLNVD